MTVMSDDALRDAVNRLRWFHQIDFGRGIVSPGWIRRDKIERQAGLIFDRPLAGKSVLDIGCWDGAYSIEASRRGAARVLATDHFAWSEACWGDRACFDLARAALAPEVEALDVDLDGLTVERVGRFDIVLFCGVLYHLRHPLAALEQVAALTTEVLILETRLIAPWSRRPMMRFYPGRELEGDPSNWWAPNRACVEAMLRDVGFRHVRFTRPDRRFRRGLFHAQR